MQLLISSITICYRFHCVLIRVFCVTKMQKSNSFQFVMCSALNNCVTFQKWKMNKRRRVRHVRYIEIMCRLSIGFCSVVLTMLYIYRSIVLSNESNRWIFVTSTYAGNSLHSILIKRVHLAHKDYSICNILIKSKWRKIERCVESFVLKSKWI